MKKIALFESVSNGISRAVFKTKEHSPEILIIVGVAGVVVSAVMACKASTKLNSVLDDAKSNIDDIHATAEEAKETDITKEEAAEVDKTERKELASAYFHTSMELAKLYAPSVVLGAVSITCILGSHNIMKKRNIALAAAYKAVSTSYKEFEGRVKEKYGDEIAKQLKYGLKDVETEKTTTDENGAVKTEKETVETSNPIGSPYAVFFDSSSKYWDDNPLYNKSFLTAEQKNACDHLRKHGYLTLAYVKERLDIPVGPDDLVIGWIYDDQNPIGDNYVDFGIFNSHSESSRRFVNGLEPVVLLDFNVDGYIYDRVKVRNRKKR